jgi:hypothetical protein
VRAFVGKKQTNQLGGNVTILEYRSESAMPGPRRGTRLLPITPRTPWSAWMWASARWWSASRARGTRRPGPDRAAPRAGRSATANTHAATTHRSVRGAGSAGPAACLCCRYGACAYTPPPPAEDAGGFTGAGMWPVLAAEAARVGARRRRGRR